VYRAFKVTKDGSTSYFDELSTSHHRQKIKNKRQKMKNSREKKQNKIRGFIFAIVGFLMLLVNAVGYVFNLDIKNPALTVIGLVFVTIGLKVGRELKN
jgi:uncharacterized membrane protein